MITWIVNKVSDWWWKGEYERIDYEKRQRHALMNQIIDNLCITHPWVFIDTSASANVLNQEPMESATVADPKGGEK